MSSKNYSIEKEITIAIAGQPNTGKSTIFNKLTSSKQRVGNWPGKTVERKTGVFRHNNSKYNLVDLPGLYSLSTDSPEEEIAREFIIKEKPDSIIIVVDASQLSRSLYMASEVITMGIPVILALNMMDVAGKKGLKIDIDKLAYLLGLPVVPMVASKNTGGDLLLKALEHIEGLEVKNVKGPEIKLLDSIEEEIRGYVPDIYSERWIAQKLAENDPKIISVIESKLPGEKWENLKSIIPDGENGISEIAGKRFEWIDRIVSETVESKEQNFERSRFDRIATHPLWGSLLGLLVILAGYVLAVTCGFGVFGILEPVASSLSELFQHSYGENLPIIAALISQGVIPGIYMISSVSAFIFGVLIFTAFFEDIGYLPRMAYVSDILMGKLGLHGKSFMPMFLGLGCNIGAVMGTRVIESTKDRLKTIVVSSHMPCPGVMVTMAFIITIFFGAVAPVVTLAVVGAFLLQIYITSVLIDKTVFKRDITGMIMELPPYHVPNIKTIFNYVWIHYKAFLKRAGSLIISIVILVWALSYFPNGNMFDSYLASAGKVFEPVGMLMGMDWRLLTCLFVAFFSKEAALISMAVIFGIHLADNSLVGLLMNNISSGTDIANDVLGTALIKEITKPSAFAFIFAILFSIPCFSTIGVIFNETKSLKWTLGSTAYYTVLSFVWGVIAYNCGLYFFN